MRTRRWKICALAECVESVPARRSLVLLRLLLLARFQRRAGVEDLCTHGTTRGSPREPYRVPRVSLGVRWLTLTLTIFAAVAGLLALSAREPPRTRAVSRQARCDRVVSPEAPPVPQDAPRAETEALPPEEEGPGSPRRGPCGFRVLTGAESHPVPGARAWVTRYDGSAWVVRRFTSDPRGEVVLPAEFRDPFLILVRKTGYVSHLECVYRGMPKEVWLRPGLTMRGRVILHHGVPVAGARVYAWDGESDAEIVGRRVERGAPSWPGFALTDQYGCFEIDGIADAFILCVVAAGYGVHRARHQPTPEMLVTLGRGGVVEGCVFDDEGRPVAGASVYAEQQDGGNDFEVAVDSMCAEREDGGYNFGLVCRTWASARTKSGPDGTYRIVGLPPACYVVTARKGLWACGDSRPVQLTDGASAQRGVTLERSAALDVRSDDAHRRLRYKLRRLDGRRVWSRFWGDINTETRGLFEGIHAGSYELHVSATPGGPKIVRRIELRPGETLRLNGRLP